MSKKVLILHGWGGSSFPHWQSWLAGELARDYGKVSFLKFSDFDEPKLDVWMEELKKELEDFKPDIVVCHSLANVLWFHLCNAGAVNAVEKLYLVAPPSLTCEIKELESFFPLNPPSDLNADDVLLVTSTNDPYLSQAQARELRDALGVEMTVIKDAGHINADSGYGPWPWMRELFE
jgi:uncharacterized protein